MVGAFHTAVFQPIYNGSAMELSGAEQLQAVGVRDTYTCAYPEETIN